MTVSRVRRRRGSRLFHLNHPTKLLTPGDYRIIRWFDKDRILVEMTSDYNYQRQLTLVRVQKGEVK
jgi:hypothetical protein